MRAWAIIRRGVREYGFITPEVEWMAPTDTRPLLPDSRPLILSRWEVIAARLGRAALRRGVLLAPDDARWSAQDLELRNSLRKPFGVDAAVAFNAARARERYEAEVEAILTAVVDAFDGWGP